MATRELTRLTGVPAPSLLRTALALALHAASRLLSRLAEQVALRLAVAAPTHGRTPAADPLYEFHAEAGAPEGALYVDGQLVGRLTGVTRL
jgi:hypothetical protein